MTALANDSIVDGMQTTADDGKRGHEVRVGMSVYWVTTWPCEAGGFWWEGGGAMGTADTRYDAVQDARATFRMLEAEEAR